MAQPIQLLGADLGRHIKNGELLLGGTWDILYKNYYSYTFGYYPFVNHHWLFGVLCYAVWKIFDFPGLSLIYALLMLGTFRLFFRHATRLSSFGLACAFGLLSFPLSTCRCEIRPEGITLLFCGLFWWLSILHQQGRLKPSRLYLWLALLQVIWVNTHVFFILGPFLIAIFWLQAAIDGRKEHAATLKNSLWLTLGMCLVNPSGLAGALLFLQAFQKFGIPISEEQSVFQILKDSPHDKLVLYFLATLPLLITPLAFVIKKQGVKPHAALLILTALFCLSALKCIRLISPYGFFFIPLASFAWSERIKEASSDLKRTITVLFLIAGILVSVLYDFNWKQRPVFGLQPHVNASGIFFKQEHLKGPVFNDYDTGGYLIFYLSPEQKLFVDDRKEAYPRFFFEELYSPMESSDAYWKKMSAQFHFNAIFLNRRTFTHQEREFIIKRIQDPTWAPVFADQYAIIFLKRVPQNTGLISRFELNVRKVTLPGNNLGYELKKR